MRPPREDTLPWYRQFWPWFLISLPAIVVVGSMFTIYMAVTTEDGLVTDDYYKEGLAIRKDAARAEAANALGVRGSLHYDASDGRIEVQLNDAAVGQLATLVVVLFHPTRSHQDQRVELARVGTGRYAGTVQTLGPANWRVSVEPTSGQWRINGRLAIPQLSSADLQ